MRRDSTSAGSASADPSSEGGPASVDVRSTGSVSGGLSSEGGLGSVDVRSTGSASADLSFDDVRFDEGPARVADVCSVTELFHVGSRGLMSGIDKRPVDRPLTVLRHGVWGDVQGDREHHGGLFKAVYAYASETREAWASSLGRECPPGSFGENLATRGFDVDGAVIGTRWRVGTTVLEVTAPRTPCRTFAAWMDEPDWARRFSAGGRCGVYLRVLETGKIAAGELIDVVDVPSHGVTVGDASAGLDAERADALLDWAAASGTVLYESLVRNALGALERADGVAGVVEGAVEGPRSPTRSGSTTRSWSATEEGRRSSTTAPRDRSGRSAEARVFPGSLRSTGRGLGGGEA
ncbi:MOSC domain-containing protein [Georgenia sp. Z1344]|uniref:MOSC domain-containing protein n=1 Tax=Georgenia sp. Z1344 TaxID=3416706 RepID=UPI003CE924B1